MLELYTNQASGLIGLGCQQGPRMIVVVQNGDEDAELPLLWQLCQALVNFGYPVAVLDATTVESQENQGLEQLLENSPWHRDENHDAPDWTVIPSGVGIQSLCSVHTIGLPNLRQLGRLFPTDGVVVLYCKVELIIPLIGSRHIEPVLAVSPTKTSLLTSYIAVKRLLISGKLKPTIVNMVHDKQSASFPSTQSVCAGLGECTKKFLNHEVATHDVSVQHGETLPNSDVQRLALILLEGSLPLCAEYEQKNGLTPSKLSVQFDMSARSH